MTDEPKTATVAEYADELRQALGEMYQYKLKADLAVLAHCEAIFPSEVDRSLFPDFYDLHAKDGEDFRGSYVYIDEEGGFCLSVCFSDGKSLANHVYTNRTEKGELADHWLQLW